MKESYLRSELFYPELPEESGLKAPAESADKSPGLHARRQWIVDKKKVFFSCRIGLSAFHSDRFLPPMVDIRLKFVQSNNRMGLIQDQANKNFRIKLLDLKLQIRKVKPAKAVFDRFQCQLALKPCYLPYKFSRARHFIMPSGITSQNLVNVSTGILPQLMVFVMLKDENFSSNGKANPFHFEHFNLSKFQVTVGGQPVFSHPMQPNFDTGDYIEMYRALMDNIGISHSNNSIGLTLEHFLNGTFIMAVDLTSDKCAGFHTHE